MKEYCFLDMDGVLADFVSGICKAHNRETPYTHIGAYGVFDMEKLWGISATQFWNPIRGKEDFWINLDKTEEADEIVNLAELRFGAENVAILTAPSIDPVSISGKREWIKKYYPQFEKKIIFASAKKFLAGHGNVLIDDRDKNIIEFTHAGGIGIRVPRLWNSDFNLANKTLLCVEKALKKGMVYGYGNER